MRTSFKKFFDAFMELNTEKPIVSNRKLSLVYRLRTLLEKRYNVIV